VLVLGYVRVSSIEQEGGFGRDIQRDAIVAYCQAAGITVPEIHEESESAESITKRLVLLELIARAKDAQRRGVQAHIVFAKLDRLARDLIDQESVVNCAMSHGFRLHSTSSAENEVLNPAYAGDPMRVAMRQIVGVFAQLERATIQGRLDSGLAAKAKQGGSTGGRLPFGYRPMNDDIAIDEGKAPAVRRLFELHDRGLDQASVAAMLALEYPLLCGHWQKFNVSRMLRRRDLYARGLYRSRLGVVEVARPELRILPEVPVTAWLNPRSAGEPIVWARFPDPLASLTISLLLDQPPQWIQQQVIGLGIPVTWVKGRMLIARKHCEKLEAASALTRESKAKA
jgi:DNA invertase Pin-like site-specific DNA recombinase